MASLVSMSCDGNGGDADASSTKYYSSGSYEHVSSMSPRVDNGDGGNGAFEQNGVVGGDNGSMGYSCGMYEGGADGSCMSRERALVEGGDDRLDGDPSANEFHLGMNWSDDEDYNYEYEYQSYLQARQDESYNETNDFYGMGHMYGAYRSNFLEEVNYSQSSPCRSLENLQAAEGTGEESQKHDNGDDQPISPYRVQKTAMENLDFENDNVLWLPPEPEDEDDEKEIVLSEDEEDGKTIGEWGYRRSSNNLVEGDLSQRDKSNEDHRRAMRNVVGGHFRALITQLLQVENIALSGEDHNDSWLDLITSLSWEAAALLKPDMSESARMDPGGYVKVKCLPCGRTSDSMVIKGVVCKKNVAHRRMASRMNKPRVLILGGALEYQRVSHHLSSFDTLLQQEMDHLKMAVAKIHSHNPNLLLVEKSVSRFAQEYLLEKNISLVLNLKRPLLERIARCTGAQIVPSIDHLVKPKLGSCDCFHVEKYFDELGTAGQVGKKLTKTLMFFEGCPKPLGCTILLKGAPVDELKKVKHVLHYGIFAAYHLALETSFLADEGASLPELPLKSPITVALPDKPTAMNSAISIVRNVSADLSGKHEKNQLGEPQTSGENSVYSAVASDGHFPTLKLEQEFLIFSHQDAGIPQDAGQTSVPYCNGHSSDCTAASTSVAAADQFSQSNTPSWNTMDCATVFDDHAIPEHASTTEASQSQVVSGHLNGSTFSKNDQCDSKEDLLSEGSSLADHLSILVSLTSRCVWKGTLCERARLLRIKYYGNADKPLGRFLQDHLFNPNYHCRSCGMPPDAHIHCYTHQQGNLTISVRNMCQILLPGKREGKIWMWHRCLRCPRANGLPPSTQRVLMSDAAWGLSFGKFLELSFSNHAAATRVASCGHSLHRHCLRFYGCGNMVACFSYMPTYIHSVYLPPPKLEFKYDKLEWIQREAQEVMDLAELLFTEVCNGINQVSDKPGDPGSLGNGIEVYHLRMLVSTLENLLRKEKQEFEEFLRVMFKWGLEVDQSAMDILELNRLRRQLLLYSYVWDQRLIYASNLDKSTIQESGNAASNNIDKSVKVGKSATSKLDGGVVDHGADCLDVNPLVVNQAGNACHVDQLGELFRETTLDQPNDSKSMEVGMSDPNNLSLDVTGHTEGMSPCLAKVSGIFERPRTDDNHSCGLAAKENEVAHPTCNSVDQADPKQSEFEVPQSPVHQQPSEISDVLGISAIWPGMPFADFHASLDKDPLCNKEKLKNVVEYNPAYIMSFRELLRQGGARLLLPLGAYDVYVPVYDDEPTSIIAYALASKEYQTHMLNGFDSEKDGSESSSSAPLVESTSFLSLHALGKIPSDDSILSLSGSWNSMVLDPLVYTKELHAKVSFSDDGPHGKVKYTVTAYYAARFEALRRICCPSELDFIRSLSRCKEWGAQGGKSNVFFAKSLDDRFIVKQVTKTELDSFIKFAPAYFKYLTDSVDNRNPICLAKILGMYQVTSKHLKGGKETKMDVLVMENLLFCRNVTRLYDLKGSCRSRYNSDSSGGNKVLLDQNFLETIPTSPIFLGKKAKHLLDRAIWNDTSFLASIDVMDYSLLVGVDEEKHELVLGIIDFMRQYTWDKHLETWVKASGILGGPKNVSPTVISPKQYKKRFRKAMSTYFLVLPEQWTPSEVPLSRSSSDVFEDEPGAITSH